MTIHEFLSKYESIWLFLILSIETVFSFLIWRMARIEFDYDKEWNERKAARRKRHLQFEELNQGEGK